MRNREIKGEREPGPLLIKKEEKKERSEDKDGEEEEKREEGGKGNGTLCARLRARALADPRLVDVFGPAGARKFGATSSFSRDKRSGSPVSVV